MGRTSCAGPRPAHTTEHHPISRGGVVGVLAALAAGVLLAACAQTTAAGALADISDDIGAVANLSWPVTAYLVTEAVGALVLGKLAAIANPRPVYWVAMGTFVAGAIFAGLSPTLGQLIVSRAIQGIGAGGLLALAFEVVGELASPLGRVRYRACLAVVWGMGTLVGPFLGGLLTEHLGWRWVFYVNAPIGVLVLLAVVAGLRLPRRGREGELDLIGAVLLTLQLVLVLLYVSWQGPLRGWTTAGGLVLLAEAIVALILLLAWENRVKEPLLPLQLLNRRDFIRVTVTAVLAGSGLFGILMLFPLREQVVLHITPMWSGVLALPMTIAALVGIVPVFPRRGHRILLAFGTGSILVSALLLIRLPVDPARWQTLVLFGIAGVGLGIVWRLALRIARSAAPPEAASKAVPTILFLQIVGCTIGAALACSALSLRLAHGANLIHIPGFGPDTIRALPDTDRAAVLDAFLHAGQQVLITAAVITAVAFVLGLSVRTVALRSNKVLAESEPEPIREPVVDAEAAEPVPMGSEDTARTEPVENALPHPEPEPATTPRSLAPQPVESDPEETEPAPVETPARRKRRSPVRRVVTACCLVSAVLVSSYLGGLVYAGPGVLRGTTVHGVDIGGLQPAQAERKLDQSLRPASAAPIPVQAGNERLSLDPRNAGLDIDVPGTVAATARRSANPIRLADILLHAPRRVEIHTTVDDAHLNAALTQIDHQVHHDPRDGTITFGSGIPRVVPSQDGQSLDMARSAAAVRNGYMRGRIALPLTVLHPRVGNDEVQRAMHEFAEPAVSGPVVVSAEGKTATLQPSVFAPHLSMTADDSGRLHPALDGDGLLSDANAQLGPLQTQPQAGGVRIVDGSRVRTPPQDGHIIKGDDLAGSMLRVLPQPGYRVAYVPLTTVHP
jgi:EmrB/QacA subfamily drug resistance transporter